MTLQIDSPAPVLEVQNWVRGEPLELPVRARLHRSIE